MPVMYQESKYTNDKSNLTEGRHPAFLCLITSEDIPPTWKSYQPERGITKQWRWHYAVWERAEHIATHLPEHQTAVSTQTFSPGGTNPPSKTYLWVKELLGRTPAPGERIDLDPLLPLPCSLKIARHKNDGSPTEYANVLDMEGAPDLAAHRTPELCRRLMAQGWVLSGGVSTPPPQAQHTAPPSTTPPARGQNMAPPAPTNPGMVGWGNAIGAALPPPTKPTW